MTQKYIYVGITNDINRRVNEHNTGRSKTTKSRAPFKLIYSETVKDRREARKREKYLKSGIGKEFLKNIAGVAEW